MKRYIIATRSNGYCGCDETECYIFPEGTTDKEIDKYIAEGMYDYAENYEYFARGGWDKDWEDEDEVLEYYDNCYFDWHDANENDIEDYEGEWFSI